MKCYCQKCYCAQKNISAKMTLIYSWPNINNLTNAKAHCFNCSSCARYFVRELLSYYFRYLAQVSRFKNYRHQVIFHKLRNMAIYHCNPEIQPEIPRSYYLYDGSVVLNVVSSWKVRNNSTRSFSSHPKFRSLAILVTTWAFHFYPASETSSDQPKWLPQLTETVIFTWFHRLS